MARHTVGRSPATVDRYKVTLSSIYRYGKQRDKIQVNTAREVSQLKLNNGVIRYLKPEAEKRLRAVLQGAVDACFKLTMGKFERSGLSSPTHIAASVQRPRLAPR